jgi:Fe-S oxidoreductase
MYNNKNKKKVYFILNNKDIFLIFGPQSAVVTKDPTDFSQFSNEYKQYFLNSTTITHFAISVILLYSQIVCVHNILFYKY